MSVGPAIGGILAVYSFRWLFLVDGTTSILAGAMLVFGADAQFGATKDARARVAKRDGPGP